MQRRQTASNQEQTAVHSNRVIGYCCHVCLRHAGGIVRMQSRCLRGSTWVRAVHCPEGICTAGGAVSVAVAVRLQASCGTFVSIKLRRLANIIFVQQLSSSNWLSKPCARRAFVAVQRSLAKGRVRPQAAMRSLLLPRALSRQARAVGWRQAASFAATAGPSAAPAITHPVVYHEDFTINPIPDGHR